MNEHGDDFPRPMGVEEPQNLKAAQPPGPMPLLRLETELCRTRMALEDRERESSHGVGGQLLRDALEEIDTALRSLRLAWAATSYASVVESLRD